MSIQVGDTIKGKDVGKKTLELVLQLGKEVNRLRQSFQAFKTSAQTSTTSWADLTTWVSPVENEDPSFSFNTTTGVLTIQEDGRYEITLHINGNGGASRSVMRTKVLVDTGGGYALPTQMFADNYGPRLASLDECSLWIPAYQLDMDKDDILKIQIQHIGIAVDMTARLSIRRIT